MEVDSDAEVEALWDERRYADRISSQNICSLTLVVKEDICLAGLGCQGQLLWLALLGVTGEKLYVLGEEQSL